ncbi:hypothetical protein MTR67_005860 [Solanum verrucosum]|uniref:Uncharacterized protein n=1 Tax=Solanum verrucosum TaxID=315347 RepID=A0AAF0TGM5_SOLVR|nr:hypothetical protein MTR67_005860 [Solanum verrucosum]
MILLNPRLICESFPLQDKLKSHPVQKSLHQLPAFGHHELRDAASSQKITHYSPALQAAGLTSHHHRRPARIQRPHPDDRQTKAVYRSSLGFGKSVHSLFLSPSTPRGCKGTKGKVESSVLEHRDIGEEVNRVGDYS